MNVPYVWATNNEKAYVNSDHCTRCDSTTHLSFNIEH